MSYYDTVRRLMEMERRRPSGVELDTPGLSDPDAGGTYGNPFSGQRGSLAGGESNVTNPMAYFKPGPTFGPGSVEGRAMLDKLMQPLPNKSTMQDNAMGVVKGFMEMGGGFGGGGGGGMSTSGLGAGAGSFGGAEGGVGAFQGGGTTSAGTNFGGSFDSTGMSALDPGYNTGSAVLDLGQPGAAASPPPSVPDLGEFEYAKAGGDNAPSYDPGTGLVNPEPTERSAYREQLKKLVTGQSPAQYFAKQMGATPAQQAAAKIIEQTLMTRRQKGQAGRNVGRVAAMVMGG